MKNKIFMMLIIMGIICIGGCSKKLTQPDLDKTNSLQPNLNEIYNLIGVHLDQIIKYDDDTYGITYTEKELCNKKFFQSEDGHSLAYCSWHAKIKMLMIYFIKTKQVCISHMLMTVSGVRMVDEVSNCDTTKSYIENNSSHVAVIQLIKSFKTYIDSYQ